MEISMDQLFRLIKKNMVLILLFAVVGCAGAYAVSSVLIPKTYISTLKLYVSSPGASKGSTTDINELNYAQKVVNTYIEMLETNSFYQKVIDSAGLNYSPEQLKEKITFSSLNNTEVFSAQVSANKPEQAKAIADVIADLAPQTIKEFKEDASLKIVDYGNLPEAPSSPKLELNAVAGLILGLFLSVALILLRDKLNVRIKNEEGLTERYNLPVIASIPAFNPSFSKNRKTR
jgi:Capsular polysaccharide biosynthesis protein